jgi:RHS repeat-associated protein
MLPKRETLLCRYHYDPLDRLVDCTPSAQVSVQRFYLKDRLATEIQGVVQRSIMQHDDQLLAQQQRQSGAVETRLLATDQHRSVLNVLAAVQRNPLAYTPYGHRPPESGLLSLLGFNGERPDPVTGCYLLGNGYRAFNPVLMRFNSPDSWSPFGEGGLNAYGYCVGDPVNRVDPTGHANWLVKLFRNISRRVTRPSNTPTMISTASSTEIVMRRSVTVDLPPPAYSPPRSPRTSVDSISDVLQPINEGQLSAEITRLESQASIQRSILNDIADGRLPTTSEAHSQRVNEWHRTQRHIVRLQEHIPPPAFEEALKAPRPVTAPDGLPDYKWAVRNT